MSVTLPVLPRRIVGLGLAAVLLCTTGCSLLPGETPAPGPVPAEATDPGPGPANDATSGGFVPGPGDSFAQIRIPGQVVRLADPFIVTEPHGRVEAAAWAVPVDGAPTPTAVADLGAEIVNRNRNFEWLNPRPGRWETRTSTGERTVYTVDVVPGAGELLLRVVATTP